MLRALFLFIFLAVVYDIGFAQEHESKKSSKSYSRYKSSSSVDDASKLLRQASSLKSKDPSEALTLVKDALGISIAGNDVMNEARCYILIAQINEGIREWKLAEENYQEAHEKLNVSFPNSPEQLTALTGLGFTLLQMHDFPNAITWYEAAIIRAGKENDQTEIRLNLSEAHYQNGNYTQALKVIEGYPIVRKMARSQDERINNQRIKIQTRMNMALQPSSLYDNSLNTARQEIKIDRLQQNSLSDAKNQVSEILKSQNRNDDEIALRNKSIEFNTVINEMGEVAKDKVEISKALTAEGQTSAALRELEGAAVIADTLHNPDTQAQAYLALARFYESLGKYKPAAEVYQKYSLAVAAKDTSDRRRLMQKTDLIRQQRDIEQVTKITALGQREETIAKAAVDRQQLIIYGLLLIILIIGVTSWFIYRNARNSQRANRLLALKSLRSQMNPHFIFNALNSVNRFIMDQDERTANKFLNEFSTLMRLVLENSQEDFITLEKEMEIIALYLRLEHHRFSDKFEYTIDDTISTSADSIQIPPMLIQPYLENAIWHGLRYRDSPGKLMITFKSESNRIMIGITDDGIGRKKSAALKTINQKKHRSTALQNIEERIGIINKVYHSGYSVAVSDLAEGYGTRVEIMIPIRNI